MAACDKVRRLPVAALVAVAANVMAFTCLTTGIQGAFEPFLQRGVFSDECDLAADNNNNTADSSTPCPEQRNHMAEAVDTALSLLNLSSLLTGALIDQCGPRRSALGYIALGTLAIACSGFAPDSGGIFFTCIILCAVAHGGCIATMVTRYIPLLILDRGTQQFWTMCLPGFSSLSAWMGNVVGAFIGVRELPLAAIMFTVGVALGAPLFAIFAVPMESAIERVQAEASVVNPDDDDDERAADDSSAGPKPPSDLASVPEVLQPTRFAALAAALKQPALHAAMLNSCCAVVFGYVFIANVGSFLQWKGATEGEVTAMRQTFNIMYSAGGFVTLGYAVATWRWADNNRRARRVTAALHIVCLVGTVISAFSLPLHGQYLTFAFVIIWRGVYFGLINASIVHDFKSYTKALSTLFGLNWSIAGAVSLGGGVSLTRVLASDATAWRYLLPIWAAVAISAIVLLAVCPDAKPLPRITPLATTGSSEGSLEAEMVPSQPQPTRGGQISY